MRGGIDKLREQFMKSLLGVFGISVNESPQFYVDVFLGALSALSLLIVSTLALAGKHSWLLYVAIGVFFASVFVARRKREVAAAALLFVAIRFIVVFLISFRLNALVGILICVIGAALVLRFMRKRSSAPNFPPS